MKKFLVVLLALVMVFGLATTAFAADTQIPEFNDISSQSQAAQDAIQRLAVLGVLQGNDGLGGAYRPGDTLTRAEFAKIICLLSGAGNDNTANAYKSSPVTQFTDVSAGNWYTGWVALASEAGYFKGDTNGAFRPNATITMQEVSTVMLRVVGYDDHLGGGGGGNFGTWPSNYNSKARSVGLADGVVYAGTTNITRGDMALMGDNMLEMKMVTYVSDSYAANNAIINESGDSDWFVEVSYRTNEDETGSMNILKQAFDSRAATVRFAAAEGREYDEIAAWSYDDYVDGQFAVQIAARRLTPAKNDDWVSDTRGFLVADNYFITKDFNFPELANMTGKITYKDDSKREICFIQVTSSYELGKEVYKDGTRVYVDGKSLSQSSHPLYVSGTNTSFRDLSASDVLAFSASSSDSSDTKMPAKVYLDDEGRVYGVKNYDAFNYEAADSTRVVGFGIFEEITSGITGYKVGNTSKDWDIDTAKKEHSIYKDGEFVTAEKLEVNDVVYFLKNNGVDFFLAYSPLSGELTKQTNSKLTVSGYGYKGVDSNFYFSDDGGEDFDEYTIFNALAVRNDPIDEEYFGNVTYVPAYNYSRLAWVATDADATSKYIGVITEVGFNTVLKSGNQQLEFGSITIMNGEGKEVTYKFESDFKTEYNKYAVGSTNSFVDYLPTDTSKLVGFGPGSASTYGGFGEGMIVKLRINSKGELTEIEKAVAYEPQNIAGVAKVEVDRAKNQIKVPVTLMPNYTGISTRYYTLADDAVIFQVKDDGSGTTTVAGPYDSVKVVSVASLLSGDFEAFQVVDFDVNKNVTSEIKVLYVVMEGSANQMGVLTSSSYGSSKYRYTIDGVANIAAVRHQAAPSFIVFGYNSDSEVTLSGDYRGAHVTKSNFATVVANGTSTVNVSYNALDYLGDAVYSVDEDYLADAGEVTKVTGSTSSGTITLANGAVYTLNRSTILYNLDDDENITRINDLKDRNVVVVADTNVALYVIGSYKSSTSASSGTGTTSDPTAAASFATALATALPAADIRYTEGNDYVTLVSASQTLYTSLTVPAGVELVVVNATGLTVAGGTLTVNGTITGDVKVTGGTLSLGSNGEIDGDVTVSGGTATISGEVTGDLTVSTGTVTVSGAVGGDVTVSGGTVTISGAVDGNLNITGGTVTLSGAVTGIITHSGGSLVLNSNRTGITWTAGALEIGSGNRLTQSSDFAVTTGLTLTNKGTLDVTGAITVDGTLTNSGTVKATTAITVDGTLTNSGTVEAGTVLSGTGTLTNSSSLKAATLNTATFGTFSNSGTVTVSGTLTSVATLTGGTYVAGTLAGASAIDATLTAGVLPSTPLMITSSGRLTLGGDHDLVANNLTILNGGKLYLNGKTLASNATITVGAADAIIGSGRVELDSTAVVTGTGSTYLVDGVSAPALSTNYSVSSSGIWTVVTP